MATEEDSERINNLWGIPPFLFYFLLIVYLPKALFIKYLSLKHST